MPAQRVLILEDQPFQRGFLANMFTALPGVAVDTSGDAAHAVAMCQLTRYDLVVTDLMMPGIDGIQFIQTLASQEHRPMLALVSSASQRMMASARLMAESLGLTVLGILPKPVSVADITGLVERLRQARRDSAAEQPAEAPPLSASRERLIQAIDTDEITAWFQPKKSLDSGLVVAAEALVRWRHPEWGTLEAARFLPLVELHGLEAMLLRHILKASVQAQAGWHDLGFRIPVSINLPPHLLEQRDLPDQLLELTLANGGNAADLCFELMESSTTGHVSDYYAGACRLRMKGFGLAQDDFGQGLSSVHNLVNTPFTEVKIDRALVRGCARDPALRSALATVVALGSKLGLNIVAEGVETDAELATLRKLGCNQVQGFLISRAVPADSFSALLGREKAAHHHVKQGHPGAGARH
jgi:EAL domain-containing protein (putative c-di-GMP-specific phosphodiesterase class I)/AmiR/NasT family two-component response regulator